MDTRIMDQISTCFNLYNSSGIRFGQATYASESCGSAIDHSNLISFSYNKKDLA